MKPTKKKAIKYVLELWEWLEETGESKRGWVGWKGYEREYGESDTDCPLCDYSENSCIKCPLITELKDDCYDLGFKAWNAADDENNNKDRKKYAKLFLEQLRRLK